MFDLFFGFFAIVGILGTGQAIYEFTLSKINEAKAAKSAEIAAARAADEAGAKPMGDTNNG
jgi:uncharacterized protein involved in exopolysaccharide biosynthesis